MKIHDDPDDQDYVATMRLNARQITDEQFQKFEGYAAEIFSAFGLDIDTAATKDTPRRFIKGLFDVTNGYEGDPKLVRVFPTECRGGPDCRLSQVVDSALHDGPQTITLRGKPTAVVVSFEEFSKLTQPRTTLSQFFRQSPLHDVDLDLRRSDDLSREVEL